LHSLGILSFVKGVLKDISDIPGDVVDGFEQMIQGPGGVVGIAVAGGMVFVGMPGSITAALPLL
jgi:molybdopterin biosynthesis enzyme